MWHPISAPPHPWRSPNAAAKTDYHRQHAIPQGRRQQLQPRDHRDRQAHRRQPHPPELHRHVRRAEGALELAAHQALRAAVPRRGTVRRVLHEAHEHQLEAHVPRTPRVAGLADAIRRRKTRHLPRASRQIHGLPEQPRLARLSEGDDCEGRRARARLALLRQLLRPARVGGRPRRRGGRRRLGLLLRRMPRAIPRIHGQEARLGMRAALAA